MAKHRPRRAPAAALPVRRTWHGGQRLFCVYRLAGCCCCGPPSLRSVACSCRGPAVPDVGRGRDRLCGSARPFLAALHGSPDYGGRAIVWLFAIVWGTDVFAYFGGRLIGGPKLWPHISPGKTWSGTLTGIFAGAILGVAAASIGLSPPPQIIPIFFLGLVAAALSQAGDIFESSFKRRFGVKDSSRLIPGHGGFMDRLDAFIA